jgi:hypothetical protein
MARAVRSVPSINWLSRPVARVDGAINVIDALLPALRPL